MRNLKIFFILCSAHGDFPVDWADLMCRTRKPAAIHAQIHPQARARSRVQGHSIKGCLLLHLKRQLQLIRLHLNRSPGHQRAGLAMLSKAFEDLCSPAIAAPVMSYSNGVMSDNIIRKPVMALSNQVKWGRESIRYNYVQKLQIYHT